MQRYTHKSQPIREVHHNEAKHHTATSLPPISLAEFQKQGGSLTGRAARTETFAGEPRAAGEAASTAIANAASGSSTGAAPPSNNIAPTAPPASNNAPTAASGSAAGNTAPANDQTAGKPLARSPTGPSQPRRTMRDTSAGSKEV